MYESIWEHSVQLLTYIVFPPIFVDQNVYGADKPGTKKETQLLVIIIR